MWTKMIEKPRYKRATPMKLNMATVLAGTTKKLIKKLKPTNQK